MALLSEQALLPPMMDILRDLHDPGTRPRQVHPLPAPLQIIRLQQIYQAPHHRMVQPGLLLGISLGR